MEPIPVRPTAAIAADVPRSVERKSCCKYARYLKKGAFNRIPRIPRNPNRVYSP